MITTRSRIRPLMAYGLRARSGARGKRIEADPSWSDEEEEGEPARRAEGRVDAQPAIVEEGPAIEVRSPIGEGPGARNEDFRALGDGIGALIEQVRESVARLDATRAPVPAVPVALAKPGLLKLFNASGELRGCRSRATAPLSKPAEEGVWEWLDFEDHPTTRVLRRNVPSSGPGAPARLNLISYIY